MIFRKNTNRLCFRLLLPFFLLLALVGEVSAQAAAIVFATGSASIIAADGSSRRAERGAALAVGETVDTGDGKAQLKFRDGASISLQPGTQFRVEQFRFSEQNGRASEDDQVVMRFLKGALRAVSGLVGKERRQQYRMDTTVGTIGIRGTEYGATMGDGGLSVTTYSGLVEVCNSAGCAQVGPGQTLIVPDGNSRPRLQPGNNLPGLMPGAAAPQLPAPTPMTTPVAPPQQETHVPPPANSPGYGAGRTY
jgi:hypothetical protein